jgi:hypothetical protein
VEGLKLDSNSLLSLSLKRCYHYYHKLLIFPQLPYLILWLLC